MTRAVDRESDDDDEIIAARRALASLRREIFTRRPELRESSASDRMIEVGRELWRHPEAVSRFRDLYRRLAAATARAAAPSRGPPRPTRTWLEAAELLRATILGLRDFTSDGGRLRGELEELFGRPAGRWREAQRGSREALATLEAQDGPRLGPGPGATYLEAMRWLRVEADAPGTWTRLVRALSVAAATRRRAGAGATDPEVQLATLLLNEFIERAELLRAAPEDAQREAARFLDFGTEFAATGYSLPMALALKTMTKRLDAVPARAGAAPELRAAVGRATAWLRTRRGRDPGAPRLLGPQAWKRIPAARRRLGSVFPAWDTALAEIAAATRPE